MAEGAEGCAAQRRRLRRRVLVMALIAVVAAVAGFTLLVNIVERKQEAKHPCSATAQSLYRSTL